MTLDLPNGPWNKIASCEWNEYPLSIYQNPSKAILVILFDKESENKKVLVLLKKVLVVEGDLSKFFLSQRRDFTLIEKASRNSSLKYLLIGPPPLIVDYSQDSVVEAVKDAFKEASSMAQLAVEVLRGFKASAKELKEADDEVITGLFGDPMMLFSLSSTCIPSSSPANYSKALLGVNREGKEVEIKLESLKGLVVIDGQSEKRKHMLHILSESALMNGIPVIMFDSEGIFSGLALPNRDSSKFSDFKMSSSPLGFPYKELEAGKGLFVDLSFLSHDFFCDVFGFPPELRGLIQTAFEKKPSSVLEDLITSLGEATEKVNTQYILLKAIRALRVVQKKFPNLFGKNYASELQAPWDAGVGKFYQINLSSQQKEVHFLLMSSILNSLQKTPSSQLSLVVVFEPDASLLSSQVLESVKKLSSQGIAFVYNLENELELKKIGLETQNKIDLVQDEAVLNEDGEGLKRFTVRPAYSQCTETQ